MVPEPALEISEIFYSIQGESSHSGLPCVFFRLAGCNLRCSFCDARYTYEEPGRTFPLAELFSYAARFPHALVEITGGEPLLQENVYALMVGLLARGRTVLLETNGSIDLNRVPAGVKKIVDLKCPDSTMHQEMNLACLEQLGPEDELKFVISSDHDYDWAVAMIQDHALAGKAGLLFSANSATMEPRKLAEKILADQLPIRFQVQLHTLLWPDKKRGY